MPNLNNTRRLFPPSFATRFCQILMNSLREKSCLQHQIQAGLTVLILEFLFTDLPLKHTISCYSLLQRKAALMVGSNLYFSVC